MGLPNNSFVYCVTVYCTVERGGWGCDASPRHHQPNFSAINGYFIY
jgi:hypothetical protein